MSLIIKPIELKQANELVSQLHRHHKPVQGHRYSVGAYDTVTNKFVGAATVGRPVARHLDQSKIVEVTRLVTDGTKNACSILYSACARVAKELGYEKIQTYILDIEPGTSLIASGWICEDADCGGGFGWHSRDGRTFDQPVCKKQRWVKILK